MTHPFAHVENATLDWAAESDEEDNIKATSTGSTDHTLIGEAASKEDYDATGFLTAGKNVAGDFDQPPEDKRLMSTLHPIQEPRHSIETILSRPVKIATLTFSTGQAAGTQLSNTGYDVLTLLRNNEGFRLAREKLSGFYGVHMNAHLKITLNAQPFEVGFFQIYFVPFVNTYGQKLAPNFTPSELLLPYSTGCPNVFCNISLQSSVELKIPYTGPTTFINMTNPTSDFGTFYVQSIVPITDSTNNASCELSVYMYFTEVTLFGASPRTWTLQMDGCPEPPPNEADAKTNPIRSGPLSRIGKSLMPVLDELGLSAPDANPNPQRFRQDPYASPATVDTTKTPLKTSYTFKHHLDIGQLGIDKQDEMDIPYFCFKPTYLNQFSWNTTQDAGTLLYSYKVEPNCILNTTINAKTATAPTRLRYMANVFRYWRGTIRFTIHVIANKFHSGRLRFVLSLGGSMPQGRLGELYPYAFNQIVDLRDATSFVVDCPFFASTPYRLVPQDWSTTSGSYENPTTGTTNLVDSVPYLQIFVENELRAPDTTTTSIQIVTLQSATKDLEFSIPNSTTSFPFWDYVAPNVQATRAVDTDEEFEQVTHELQGDMIKPIPMVPGVISKQVKAVNPHKFTTGEKIGSIRQLIKRYQLIGSGAINYSSANTTQDQVIYPFAFRKPTNENFLSNEMLSYFRAVFTFFRGSIRYLLTCRENSTQYVVRYDPHTAVTTLFSTSVGTTGTKVPIRQIDSYVRGDYTSLPMTANIPYYTNLQGGMEVEFPYYSRFHKLGTAFIEDYTQYEQSVRAGLQPAGVGTFSIYSDNETTMSNFVYVYRSAADDLTLGYLLGAPLTFVNISPIN